jgi:hypothetical protein
MRDITVLAQSTREFRNLNFNAPEAGNVPVADQGNT